jgi:hypothetical protein
MANALIGTIPLLLVDANEQIKVAGFGYPTTYAELARLPADKLWNRYVGGKAWPNAKEAFLVARALPSVTNLVITDPVPQQLPENHIAVNKVELENALNAVKAGNAEVALDLLAGVLGIPCD